MVIDLKPSQTLGEAYNGDTTPSFYAFRSFALADHEIPMDGQLLTIYQYLHKILGVDNMLVCVTTDFIYSIVFIHSAHLIAENWWPGQREALHKLQHLP